MPQKISNEIKICISAKGSGLDAFLDPRFGRAEFFLIVDNKGELIKAVKNTGIQAMHGAGVTAAQAVVDEKVDAVITGNVGPNASMVLNASGIKIFNGNPGMIIKDVIKEYQAGKLREVTKILPSHSGFGPGLGQGMGRGFGRKGK